MFNHGPGLGRGGRIENRHFGIEGHQARVLLGLRRVGTGIVGGHNHKATFYPGVSGAKERIGGHIQTNLFHSYRGAYSGPTGSQGHLKGYFFVGRPFGVYLSPQFLFVLYYSGQNFGTGSARISRCHPATLLHQA